MGKEKKSGKILKTVQGFRICQVIDSKKQPTNEIAICRGKNEVKKYSINQMQEAIDECVRLAEKSKLENSK